jgi:hypothetical protein
MKRPDFMNENRDEASSPPQAQQGGVNVSGKISKLLTSVMMLALVAGCSTTNGSGLDLGLGKKKPEPQDPNKPVIVQGA